MSWIARTYFLWHVKGSSLIKIGQSQPYITIFFLSNFNYCTLKKWTTEDRTYPHMTIKGLKGLNENKCKKTHASDDQAHVVHFVIEFLIWDNINKAWNSLTSYCSLYYLYQITKHQNQSNITIFLFFCFHGVSWYCWYVMKVICISLTKTHKKINGL